MWKVCQNPETGEKILIHVGYDTPVGYVELTTTTNQNYVEDEVKEIAAALGAEYDPKVPLVNYFTQRVDGIADEVYTFAVSSPAKLQEYNQAAIDAEKYMINKKVRQPFVSSWADAKGWTDEQAAMDILKTAAIFKYALLTIRQNRLSAKEKIKRVSENTEQMKIILSEYERVMMMLKGQIASG